MLMEGEIVQQDRKLEAVRNMLSRLRAENRGDVERVHVSRDPEHIVPEVLRYFRETPLTNMRKHLRVVFEGEPGVDEGGLLTELFALFFELVASPDFRIFEMASTTSNDNSVSHGTIESSLVLPVACAQCSEDALRNYEAVGRAMVKCLYEGRRMGNHFCPSLFKFIASCPVSLRDLQLFDPSAARSLQWILATVGVEQFDFHFDSVGAAELGRVTDGNKGEFVRMKVNHVLVESRREGLNAIRVGFEQAIHALSAEAAPFLTLMSQADWRVLLCGEAHVSGPQVVSTLKFHGFSKKSKVPQWVHDAILSFSEDNIRKFLVFVTGSPSLPAGGSSTVQILVRRQPASGALPVAHTCFGHLDVPEYTDEQTLRSKLMYAMQNANTFEIV
jgi:hypothetical protein